jgi:hypothetical protein
VTLALAGAPSVGFHSERVDANISFSDPARLGSYDRCSHGRTASPIGPTGIGAFSFGSDCPMMKLEDEFESDQTYVPPIIKSLEGLF